MQANQWQTNEFKMADTETKRWMQANQWQTNEFKMADTETKRWMQANQWKISEFKMADTETKRWMQANQWQTNEFKMAEVELKMAKEEKKVKRCQRNGGKRGKKNSSLKHAPIKRWKEPISAQEKETINWWSVIKEDQWMFKKKALKRLKKRRSLIVQTKLKLNKMIETSGKGWKGGKKKKISGWSLIRIKKRNKEKQQIHHDDDCY
jgi:hypothetical protein